MILYRHADPRFPFLWESTAQPAARWHDADDGPVQYFADTPDGAWAEFLRHEGITDEADLEDVRRALWVVEAPDGLHFDEPRLPDVTLTGGLETHAACRAEARRMRRRGTRALRARTAALRPGGARGWKVEGGLQPAPARDGFTVVFFGTHPELTGWAATAAGRPRSDLLDRVRHL